MRQRSRTCTDSARGVPSVAVGLAGGTTAPLLEADHDLLVSRRSDGETILAERPHLDRGALDPQEGRCCNRCARDKWLSKTG